MATITKMTFDDFRKLPEREGPIYELDEGELLMEPSPTLRHNLVRERIAVRLREFVQSNRLGIVVQEMDFRLGPDTVRNPDVAVVTTEHLKHLDLDQSPAQGAPFLAVEVVSPGNSAQDMRKKVHQYLTAGSHAVWLVYPALCLVEIYTAAGSRTLTASDSIHETALFPGLTLSVCLEEILAEDPQRA